MDDDDSDRGTGTPSPSPNQLCTVARLVLTDRTGSLSAEQTHWLRTQFCRAAEVLGVGGELRAAVLADDEMAEAHRVWTGIDGPTDVLTSDLADGAAASTREIDADVLLGLDEAARRAAELGHPLEQELLLYLVHALLHCLGHDDLEAEAWAKMHAEEDRVLRAIGVGATFARSTEARS